MGECPCCGADAEPGDYRCDECGKDLVDKDVSTSGREEVLRT